MLQYVAAAVNTVCYKIRGHTFFLCLKSVAAELFTETHHTFSRHKALSAMNRLVISKPT